MSPRMKAAFFSAARAMSAAVAPLPAAGSAASGMASAAANAARLVVGDAGALGLVSSLGADTFDFP